MLGEEQLLSITQVDNLGEIEELQLQDLGVVDEDLVPEVFNKLTSLVEINLSGNELTCIPDGIYLNNLQYLDLSRNHISDVSWLSRFPDLKDVDIADNLALTIDDSYKIMFLLKNLQFLDGKRVEQKNKIDSKFTIGLVERMQKIWEVQFDKKWKLATNKNERMTIINEFEILCQKIKYGPNSLKGYRRWRIESIIEDFMKAKLSHLEFKLKNLLNCVDKKAPTSSATSGKEMVKHKLDSTQQSGPPHKRAKLANSETQHWKFEPVIFLQCHSQEDKQDDFTTQVWCCVFEPDVSDLSKSTNKVATCGGSSICIIDCETLKVDARFKQPNEEFYTLAWTSVALGGKRSNLLVAGGCLAFLHLIHPDQDVCYGRIKVHSSPIQSIRFLTGSSTLLISAEKNGKIYLIDIDTPTIPEYRFNWKKLASFSGVECAPVRLLMVNDCLFGGTEMGLFLWKDERFTSGQKLSKNISVPVRCEITFADVDRYTMVDAIEMLTDDIVATKCPQQGAIFLWKLSDVCSHLSKVRKAKSTIVEVTLMAKLAWSATNQCFINFTVCKTFNTLLIGDDVGNMWLYDVADVIKAKKNGVEMCPLVSPRVIVPFPRCTRSNRSKVDKFSHKTIYNDIGCSTDLRHVVVACDNNIVGIFRTVSS